MTILVVAAALAPCAATAEIPIEHLRALNDQGRYREAAAAARERLVSLDARSGSPSLAVAETLDELAEALVRGGRASDVEALHSAERALSIKANVLGEHGAEYAASLFTMARLQKSRGQYDLALETHRRALRIREEALGPDHPDVAMSLVYTGQLVFRLERAPEIAREMYDRAREIFERHEGERSRGVALVLRMRADLHIDAFETEQALELHRQSLAMRVELLGPDHPDVGMNYNNIGLILQQLGRYDESAAAKAEAVRIWERSLGPEHPLFAIALSNWSRMFWFGQVSPNDARDGLERVLAIQERVLGRDHPELAPSLDHLGGLLSYLGEETAARQMYERSLAIREASFGPDDREVAQSLYNLAQCDLDIGDRASALPLLERALEIRERTFRSDDVRLVELLTSIGRIQLASGNPVAAERLLERAVSLLEAQPEGAAAIRADAFHALAGVRVRQLRYEEAVRLDEVAIEMRTAVDPDGPLVAASLRAAAQTLLIQGRDAEARVLLERALRIVEKTYGEGHHRAAEVRYDLALIAARAGDAGFALESALRAERTSVEHLRLAARGLSERQALGFAASRRSGLHLALSLLIDGAVAQDEVAAAWDAVVRARSVVLDEMASRHRAVGPAGDDELSDLFDELASARSRLAYLALQPPRGMSPSTYRRTLSELQRQKESLEIELGRRSSLFRAELDRRAIGLEDVLGELPPDAAMVAFFLYDPSVADPLRSDAAYAAFVGSSARTPPAVVPIGAAEEIDRLVREFRNHASTRPMPAGLSRRGAAGSDDSAGLALRQAVWDVLAPHVGSASTVFIVPDAALHELSFAALPAGSGSRYLVEDGPTLHYLSTERDLVRERPAPMASTLLAIGAPDFDRGAEARPADSPDWALAALTRDTGKPSPYRGPVTECESLASMRFDPIPESRLELQEISSLWSAAVSSPASPVVSLTGASAKEAWFKRMAPGRGALHIASHGFFVDPECRPVGEASPDRGLGVAHGRIPAARGENPLLMSGLAFAAANRRLDAADGAEDGILTAEEVAALDLSSVSWAVLSACDTARGTIVTGEGVLGLRRAFEIAGVDTLILSLWKADDAAARTWMRGLYGHRLAGSSTADAVRQTSLDVIEDRRDAGLEAHPFYWAGFVATGDWR